MAEATEKKKRATIDEQIAAAEKRTNQLKARKEAIEARRLTALMQGNRSEDNRRKILVGAMTIKKLDHPERGARARAALARDLDAYLTRPDDRALFADLLAEHHARQANAAPTTGPVRQTGTDDVQPPEDGSRKEEGEGAEA